MVNRFREQGPKEPSQGHGYAGGCKAGPGPCTLPPAGPCPPFPCHHQFQQAPNSCPVPYTRLSTASSAFQRNRQMAACPLYPPLPSPSLSCSHSACARAMPAIFTLHFVMSPLSHWKGGFMSSEIQHRRVKCAP